MHKPEEPIDLNLLEEMGYERRDVDLNHMPAHGIGLFVSVIVVCAISYVFMLVLGAQIKQPDEASLIRRSMPEPPNPLLQSNVTAKRDIKDLLHKEHEIATTYGVVDQTQGIYRIPVEQAIALTVQKYGKPAPAPAIVPSVLEPEPAEPEAAEPTPVEAQAPPKERPVEVQE